jgi:hypothetical protein
VLCYTGFTTPLTMLDSSRYRFSAPKGIRCFATTKGQIPAQTGQESFSAPKGIRCFATAMAFAWLKGMGSVSVPRRALGALLPENDGERFLNFAQVSVPRRALSALLQD